VTVSADHELAAPFVDAINTFYGRGDIPIGVVGKAGIKEPSRFLDLVNERESDGRYRYPHRLVSSRSAPPAIQVLRRALASQPDQSVVVVQLGFSTNLARLLDSPPDSTSPFTGRDLVERKVNSLSLMAGAFTPINGNPHFLEYNIVKDVAAAQMLADRWPTTMVFSGFEIGIAVPYPAISIAKDFAYSPHHPVAEAYNRHSPPPHNRPTWDLTSVLYVIHPDRGYFDLSPPGTVAIEVDGFTRFVPKANGKQHYLILPPDRKGRTLEALVQLSSQPPLALRPPGPTSNH
jgi:hypothetical protein